MRDLNRSSTCIPKCEDRRRPPYLRRSRSAAPIRRSSDGQAERSEAIFYTFHVQLLYSLLVRSSGCEISIDPLHAYLSAMIGDGRHISSEARTRPIFADRATGSKCYTFFLVQMSEANLNIYNFMSEANWRGTSGRQGPPYFDPKGRSGPLFAFREVSEL